jgi:hypothetical protein
MIGRLLCLLGFHRAARPPLSLRVLESSLPALRPGTGPIRIATTSGNHDANYYVTRIGLGNEVILETCVRCRRR